MREKKFMRPRNAGNIAKQLQQKKQLQLQCRQQLAHEGQEATKSIVRELRAQLKPPSLQ
ncbi:hypothetical protein Dimus_010536, partial [Dionaea muscipula]